LFNVLSSGSVASGDAYSPTIVRPSIYLKSNVKVASGDGSSANPYTLVMS